MASVQWTIHCHHCADLIDVFVSEDPWNLPEDWTPKEYPCPESNDHRVELWSENSGCPQCHGSMSIEEDGERVMWD